MTDGPWSEADVARTIAWISDEAGFDAPVSLVEKAVDLAASKTVVHAIRDYLHSLAWDGVARLDNVLSTYFGVTSSKYSRIVGAKFLISAVARVMEPGCQVDCALVLEGKQGRGKSTGLEALVGKPYFSDAALVIGSKDAVQSLRGKWLCELAELQGMSTADVNQLKQFISTRVDNIRVSYGRRNQDYPRQVVFAPTTNESVYLRDQTGNRRFWPVYCEHVIDVQKIKDDRDQLWAEALVRYRLGENWHVDTPEFRTMCELAQRERQEFDPWVGLVDAWLQSADGQKLIALDQGITTADVLARALQVPPRDMKRKHETQVGQVLRALGFVPRQLRFEGKQVRRYFAQGSTRLSQPDDTGGCDEEALYDQSASSPSQPSQPDLPDLSSEEDAASNGEQRVRGVDDTEGGDPVVTVVTTDPVDPEIDLDADDDAVHDQDRKVAE